MPAPTHNRRLTDRVLSNWIAITEEKRLPRVVEITEEAFGHDWSSCAVIKVDPEFGQSQIVYWGQEMPVPLTKVECNVLRDIVEDPLLRRVANMASALVGRPFPVMLDGACLVGNQVRLYRSIALPVSDDNKNVDHVLIAISHRDIPLEKFSGDRSTEFAPIGEDTPSKHSPLQLL